MQVIIKLRKGEDNLGNDSCLNSFDGGSEREIVR